MKRAEDVVGQLKQKRSFIKTQYESDSCISIWISLPVQCFLHVMDGYCSSVQVLFDLEFYNRQNIVLCKYCIIAVNYVIHFLFNAANTRTSY